MLYKIYPQSKHRQSKQFEPISQSSSLEKSFQFLKKLAQILKISTPTLLHQEAKGPLERSINQSGNIVMFMHEGKSVIKLSELASETDVNTALARVNLNTGHLIMMGTCLSDDQAKAIGELIIQYPSMGWLVMVNPKISPEGTHHILDSLNQQAQQSPKGGGIRHFIFQGSPLDDSHILKLEDLLKTDPGLKTVHFQKSLSRDQVQKLLHLGPPLFHDIPGVKGYKPA